MTSTSAPATSTTAMTTGGAVDSSSSSAESASRGTSADAYCGDGNTDPGEECDLGEDNALTAECRPDCNLARCGDGDVWESVEGCDDGDGDNVLEVGACAPDCSRVIEEKVIADGTFLMNGNLGANPVATMDGRCDLGYAALFAYPGSRQATNGTPFTADALIDWPLRPFTAYVRDDGTLVWITDETPLLGVRDGASVPLEAEIIPVYCSPICQMTDAMTGLNDNWTTAVADTCDGWTSSSDAQSVRFGNGEDLQGFLAGGETMNCSFMPGAIGSKRAPYCVEQ